VDALPGIELNKIAAMMAMELFSFCLVACLKKDMGREFEKLTVESIFDKIIEFPALVKAKGDRIVVTFYGDYKERHKVAVETLRRRFDETGRNMPISWRENRMIEVRFR
jgi:uncharacterized protein YbaA (DUF1428 family)